MKNITLNILGLLAIGCAFTACGREAEKEIKRPTPKQVSVYEVQAKESLNAIEYGAEIQADDQAIISTRIMGRVESTPVQAGDRVKKGQIVLKIEDKALKASAARMQDQVKAAEAHYKNTKTNYDRISALFEKQSATQKEFDDMTVALAAASAQLSTAKEALNEINSNLSYTLIRAPFDGQIATRNVNVGSMANPGAPLLSITAEKNFKAVAFVPEMEIKNTNVGQKATLFVDALDKSIEGEIVRVAPSSALTKGQYQIEIKLEDQEGLINGMYATLRTGNKMNPSILIPDHILVRKGQLFGVYLVNQQGEASLVWLRLGKSKNGMTEVLSGLNPGDQVISAPLSQVKDGMPVSYSTINN